jgi:hypothetical protein
MTDAKWQSSIDILASGGDLPKKPTAQSMYTNAIINSIDESKTLAEVIKQAAK